MEFNSLMFLLFFPCVTIIYYLFPEKVKNLFVFISSMLFYACCGGKYVFWLLGVICISYFSALGMERQGEKKKKQIITINIIVVIGLMFGFKYLNMIPQMASSLLKVFGVQTRTFFWEVVLPVGISFYTFVALGYVADVYRGKVKAEKNFVDYGAFVAFFPTLISGPIERSNNLLKQIKEPKKFDANKIRNGFCQMLWGYFQKVVVADRVCVIVAAVYNDYEAYSGIYVVVATLLYAFQIYCDFAGYSNVAIGAARVLGFELSKNFNAPYLATSISEFWKRWHISLSTWLRDYVYISLGGNRGGKVKKYRNLICTFLVSGLWHGANWTFVVWGGLHGIYSVVNDAISEKWESWKSKGATVVKCVITFALVDFAWLFFRADTVQDAFRMIKLVFVRFDLMSIFNRELAISMGMEIEDIVIMILGLLVVLLAELLRNKIDFRGKLCQLALPIRWLVFYVAIFVILIFGYYGPGFDAAQFIYKQF
ncbi:MAG: MBOAT family protein [Lachnospiraceae bacterium]|nr:MBOAT family protein [Lachnospiraceae bacterium]